MTKQPNPNPNQPTNDGEAEEPAARVFHEQAPNIPADDAMQATLTRLREDFGVQIQLGYVDLANLSARVYANALAVLLERKGVITEAELASQAQETLRELLDGLLDALKAQEKAQREAMAKAASELTVARTPIKLARLND